MRIDGYSVDSISTYAAAKSSKNETDVKKLVLNNLNGIHGVPFQFLGSVDPRIPGTTNSANKPGESGFLDSNESFGIGNMYAEKIVARMPLLFLIPCKQDFMDGFSSEEKSSVIGALLSGAADMLDFKKSGRYYSIEFDYKSYYNHVNSMCRQLAYFMGVQDKTLPNNKKVKDIDWGSQKNNAFKQYFYAGEEKSVVFYVDGADNISETMSNSTTESSLANTINSFSETAKEIKFLIGENSALGKLVGSVGEGISAGVDAIGGTIADFFASGMLSDLMNTGVYTIVNGGKLLFPKLWGDSSFDRSYSFDIKLRSPDHDNLSIFLNVMVPLVHLIALTLPKGMENGELVDPNGYISPYLCKAYMKGMFNIDMGLITNLSISRGATAQWNDDGIPTQVDVSITIEDLYSGLYLTAKEGEGSPFGNLSKLAAIVTNTAMMDYLCNLGGLNLGGDEWARKSRVYMNLLSGTLKDIPVNIWRGFDQTINNIMAKIYRAF